MKAVEHEKHQKKTPQWLRRERQTHEDACTDIHVQRAIYIYEPFLFTSFIEDRNLWRN